MGDMHMFIVLALLLIVIFSFLLTRRFHTSLHHSQRMVISMVSGTSSGLVVGVMFGSIFQGDLIFSTVLGISVGGSIGGISNCRLGMVSCIEGISAGLMSGMMGAMLGEMLSIYENVILIKLFLTLAVCSLILYPMFACTSSSDQTMPSKKWLLKPFLVFLLVMSFLLGGSWFIDEPMNNPIPHNNHSS
ncbi:hypothetical protein ACFFGV_17845 [Pontibacillus salicampi]|uniref:Uncharacterized protein n=1 Tax=Pontibacillus salicampi TaxID=1449801 RepID=A0ABV6LSS0_9BACI